MDKDRKNATSFHFGVNRDRQNRTTQGEIFDIIIGMSVEGEFESFLMRVLEGYESVSEIQEFVQIDSNIYPDLNVLFENYLKENGYN